MTMPLEITIRDIEKTPAIEDDIREKAQKMPQFFDRIESMKVVVDMPQKHKHTGKLYNVVIEALVPGKRLVVNRNEDENLYIAIRDAFDAMRQQLKDHSRKTKGTVKTHQELLSGKVVRLFPSYGFIESNDGTEFYFHKSNVTNGGHKSLEEGCLVRFLEAPAGESPTAAHIIKVHAA